VFDSPVQKSSACFPCGLKFEALHVLSRLRKRFFAMSASTATGKPSTAVMNSSDVEDGIAKVKSSFPSLTVRQPNGVAQTLS